MQPPPDNPGAALATLTGAWIRGGWVGVDLFFVLSGFLVSGLLFREYRERRTVSIRRFFIRRGLKIYPAFYFFLLLTVLQSALLRGWGSIKIRSLISECLFVQNYWRHMMDHTWSLAVEEHFYILCALLVFFLSRRKSGPNPYRSILKIFVGVALFCLVARVVNGIYAPYSFTTLSATHLRLDGLMFGVCLSYLHHFEPERLRAVIGGRRGLVAVLGAAMILPAFLFRLETTFLVYTFGFCSFYLGSGLLVLSLTFAPLPPNPLIRALAFFGTYSYSIYLWHITVRDSVSRGLRLFHHSGAWWIGFLIYFAGSFAIGTLMAKLIEVPILRIRDRLFPDRSSSK
jgi:peptidoglycan/LPS O-acetylase OafA/YrhL